VGGLLFKGDTDQEDQLEYCLARNYLYNMKIMDIISEQEETYLRKIEFENLMLKISDDLRYIKKLNFTSCSGYITYHFVSKRELVVYISYDPDHVNPIIPTDLIKTAGDEVINIICLASNMSKDEFVQHYRKLFLDRTHFTIRIERVTITLMEGILFLKDYMDNNVYNVKIERPNSMTELFENENLYLLLPEQLPRFSGDYSTTMNKLVKKCKTIFTALGKGTWKGHTYDYGKFNQPSITVHQMNKNYNKRDKIISPDFEITYNPGHVYIDGVKITSNTSPLNDEQKSEFKEWLETRFKHFGIDFSA
jgi:hypothetical protein